MNLLASDGDGNVIEIPGFDVLGRRGTTLGRIPGQNLLSLPEGSEIFELPGRRPVGLNSETGEIEEVTEYEGCELIAVSAFLPPAYTVTHTAAFRKIEGAPVLPLFAYSPLGWGENGYMTTAVRTDSDRRQEPTLFDREEIGRRARELLEESRGNRLIEHIAGTCALEYGCPAAMNYVLGRWEMPVPTSPGCNARCVGCLSYQPEGKFASTQERISFVPSVADIVDAAVTHIETARDPIVSFGQGCEGEPLLVADVIAEAIEGIRRRTGGGTINLNTNASLPDAVERLFGTGLMSMRVSVNSIRREFYEKYYRPAGYCFEDVIESVKVAKKSGGFVSMNYLVFPGFTDHVSEVEAVREFLHAPGVDMIQWRNLNIDPDLYVEVMNHPEGKTVGIPELIESFREEFPRLRHGYFNPYLGGREGAVDA